MILPRPDTRALTPDTWHLPFSRHSSLVTPHRLSALAFEARLAYTVVILISRLSPGSRTHRKPRDGCATRDASEGGNMDKLTACIFVLALSASAVAKERKYPPLPSKVITAKTVYLDNRTGYAKFSDRAYGELEKWGRFRVVDSPKDADLVFLLSASVYDGGYVTRGTSQQHGTISEYGSVDISGTTESTSSPVRLGVTHLYVIDPKTGESLWSDTKRWGNLFTGFRSATRSLIKELRNRIEASDAVR
jgi:hypothetical protein